jgi:hypothetical protein
MENIKCKSGRKWEQAEQLFDSMPGYQLRSIYEV